MRLIRVVVAIVVLALTAGVAPAQTLYAPESLDRWFRVETHVERRAKGPVVWGYVYNNTNLLAERMTVQVEAFDASGAVIGTTTTWVPGLVPATYRAYFETRAPEAAQYRARVLSFDWTGRGAGGN